ncbi:glycerol-3-phosphate dehydrogenase C-terminal domain-containing protein [Effusibacillus dendaii]|uniref:glycerol-3-phosphate dehydrogenase C-terminal domain-containing protein n=1 Tax=Effusibacillus dendaii TaxID=2743772 RepID=UPI001CF79587
MGRVNDSSYDPQQRLAVAELWYGIEQEMVVHISDCLIRRTGRLFFKRDSLAAVYPLLIDEMAKAFQWSAAEKWAVANNLKKNLIWQSILYNTFHHANTFDHAWRKPSFFLHSLQNNFLNLVGYYSRCWKNTGDPITKE